MLRIFRGESEGVRLRDQLEAATCLADRGFGKPVQRVSAPGADECAAVVRDLVCLCRALLRQDVWAVQAAILRAVATERAG